MQRQREEKLKFYCGRWELNTSFVLQAKECLKIRELFSASIFRDISDLALILKLYNNHLELT
jgi:hypothetical protein